MHAHAYNHPTECACRAEPACLGMFAAGTEHVAEQVCGACPSIAVGKDKLHIKRETVNMLVVHNNPFKELLSLNCSTA